MRMVMVKRLLACVSMLFGLSMCAAVSAQNQQDVYKNCFDLGQKTVVQPYLNNGIDADPKLADDYIEAVCRCTTDLPHVQDAISKGSAISTKQLRQYTNQCAEKITHSDISKKFLGSFLYSYCYRPALAAYKKKAGSNANNKRAIELIKKVCTCVVSDDNVLTNPKNQKLIGKAYQRCMKKYRV